MLTSHRYYFYSEDGESISPADLCYHTLLIDDNIRHRTYCLLLSHIDVDEGELRDRADTYGLTEEIGVLLQYFQTDGDVEHERMPT